MKPKFKCCDIETVCGRNLWQGVVFVGIASLVISSVVLLSSIGITMSMAVSAQAYNSDPLVAVNLVFALVSTSLSCYQIVISLLLLWQAYRVSNKVYVCSLWYVSHLSILCLYCILFIARVVICFKTKHYVTAVLTTLLGVTYEAVYIYFAIIVNSYLHSLNEDRYF